MDTAGVKSAAKRVLPSGTRVLRLPMGIGRGLRLGVDLRGGHIRLYLGFYETELNKHLRQLTNGVTCSFDIGGQVGYDALVLAKLTKGRVVSVDCDPLCCAQIQENAAANPKYTNSIAVRNAFVTGSQRSSLDKATVTLDNLARETCFPQLVKLDIEGGEVDALRGAPDLLGHVKPSWIIEVHSQDLESDVLRILREHGYCPIIVDQRRWFPDHRPIPHNRWIVAAAPTRDLRP